MFKAEIPTVRQYLMVSDGTYQKKGQAMVYILPSYIHLISLFPPTSSCPGGIDLPTWLSRRSKPSLGHPFIKSHLVCSPSVYGKDRHRPADVVNALTTILADFTEGSILATHKL